MELTPVHNMELYERQFSHLGKAMTLLDQCNLPTEITYEKNV